MTLKNHPELIFEPCLSGIDRTALSSKIAVPLQSQKETRVLDLHVCVYMLAFTFFNIYLFIFLCVWGVHACYRVCRLSENKWREIALHFYHVGPRDQTWVIRLGSEHHYPLSNLASQYYLIL